MNRPRPEPVDDGAARHLAPGMRLPAMILPATTGGEVDLACVPGVAVVFVYPWTGRPGHPNPPGWDDIPGAHGSTPEAEGFRDLYPSFRARGVALFGLSGQDTVYQREFAERLGLPFPILSDRGLAFADALGLPRFETSGVTYLTRLTLVARDGLILGACYPILAPDRHADEVLAWLSGTTLRG